MEGRRGSPLSTTSYDGTGELNKKIKRSKDEISRLHYQDEKAFPFKRYYVTNLKKNFIILAKDKDENLAD
jgi:hypothetical protein